MNQDGKGSGNDKVEIGGCPKSKENPYAKRKKCDSIGE